jgi:hypothetical protein
MAADRSTGADSDVETVEEPVAAERQPPPDRPGADGVPSRADSRAGAAAANETARDQENVGSAEVSTGQPADDDAEEADPGATDEEPFSSPDAATEQGLSKYADESADTPNPKGGTDGVESDPGSGSDDRGTVDSDGSSDSAQDASGPGATDEADEPGPSPEPASETGTADTSTPGAEESAEAGPSKDGDDQLSATDAARQEGDQTPTEEEAPQNELSDAETPEDDAGDKPSDLPGQVDDDPESSIGRKDAAESPGIIDRIKASAARGAAEETSEKITDPVKQVKDSLGAAIFQPTDRGERRVEPLDDRAYAEHTRNVESTLSEALEQGESTDVKHTLNPERTRWDPDRAEAHQQILDELYAAAADVPNDGQAVIAGGLGGAGKSTTLEDHAGIDRSKYFTINPDDIKESLGRRGMIPAVRGLSPMECSALVHEESSQIAGALAGRAYADRKNMIWDITMSSKASAAKRIQQLRDAGYTNIEGVFVHIPVDKSVERAEARHRHGLEDYRNGEGLGGRYVPPDVIRANADPTWGSVNRGVFEELKPQFDRWRIYDNSVDGRDPVLLESSDSSERNEDE